MFWKQLLYLWDLRCILALILLLYEQYVSEQRASIVCGLAVMEEERNSNITERKIYQCGVPAGRTPAPTAALHCQRISSGQSFSISHLMKR